MHFRKNILCSSLALLMLASNCVYGMETGLGAESCKQSAVYPTAKAAGIFLWAVEDKEPKVLLGLRDDEDSWCNLGGKGDPREEAYARIAAREVREESMGVYALPPEFLDGEGFFELELKDKRLTYGMYFSRVPFVPSDALNKRLMTKKGNEKEYRSFSWVPLSVIWQAIKQSPEGRVEFLYESDSKIALMQDFSSMLRLPRVREELRGICERRPRERRTFSEGRLLEVISERKKAVDSKEFVATCPEEEIVPEISKVQDIDLSSYLGQDFAKWNSSELSPSVAFLKLVLGDKFSTDTTREGASQNISTFLTHIMPSLYTSRTFDADPRGIEALTNLLAFEQEEYKKGNAVLYHGLSGEYLFIYKYYARLFSLLSGKNLGEYVLRGDHLYAVNPKTKKLFDSVLEVRNFFGNTDYGKDANVALLHGNVVLPAGPGISLSTSSTIEYFFNSYSVAQLDIQGVVTNILMLQGMLPEDALLSAQEVGSMYDSFYRFNGNSDGKNGGILGVSVPATLSKKNTLIVQSGGALYRECPSLIQMLLNVQKASEQGKYFVALSPAEKEEVRKLTNEVIMYLDPQTLMAIHGEFHYPIASGEQKLFDEMFNQMVDVHLGRILKAEFAALENSFLVPNVSEDLRRVYSGQHLKSIAVKNVLPFCIERGFLGLADYVQHCKINVDKSDVNKSAVVKALQKGHVETLLSLNKVLEGQEKERWLTWFEPKERQILWILSEPEAFCLLAPEDLTREVFTYKSIHSTNDCMGEIVTSIAKQKPKEWQTTSAQKMFERLLQENQFRLPPVFDILMELGFPLNPDTPKGSENLGRILKEQSNVSLSERYYFAQAIGKVLAYYELSYKGHENLYAMLVNASYDTFLLYPERNGRLTISSKDSCYVIENFEGKQEVSFAEMAKYINLEKGVNCFWLRQPCMREKLASYLSQKTGRTYTPELIEKFSSTGLNLFTQIPEGHTWLEEFKKVSSLEDARNMVHELEDLSILLYNLHLVDGISGGIEQTNKWFGEIIESYNLIESTTEVSEKPLSKIIRSMHEIQEKEDVFSTFARVWKYNPNFSDSLYLFFGLGEEKVDVFLSEMFKQYPALKENKKLLDMLILEFPKCYECFDAESLFETFKTGEFYEQFDIMQNVFDEKNSELQKLISEYLKGKKILDTEVTFQEYAQMMRKVLGPQVEEFLEYYGL